MPIIKTLHNNVVEMCKTNHYNIQYHKIWQVREAIESESKKEINGRYIKSNCSVENDNRKTTLKLVQIKQTGTYVTPKIGLTL